MLINDLSSIRKPFFIDNDLFKKTINYYSLKKDIWFVYCLKFCCFDCLRLEQFYCDYFSKDDIKYLLEKEDEFYCLLVVLNNSIYQIVK